MKYIKLYENYLLTEKLTEVIEDVDWIYEKYFKKGYDYIEENNKLNMSLFISDMFSSKELISPICKGAHEINPISIYINDKKINTNNYNPFEKEIHLGVNKSAIEYALDFDTLSDATNYLDDDRQKISFTKEFKETSMKGSIHHELAHWIDDTFNNEHLKKKLQKQKDSGIRIKNVNFTKFELQGQIHNILQLKRKWEKIWDTITFDEMVKLSPSLSNIMSNRDYEAREKWIFDLKKRMYREGLLGKGMYN